MLSNVQFNDAGRNFASGISDTRFVRVLSVLPAAVLVTLGLVAGMERLVRIDPDMKAPPTDVFVVPNPILVERTPTPVERFKPEPPTPVEQPPEMPKFEPTVDSAFINEVPTARTNDLFRKPAIPGYSGSTPIPTVMVQPNYPTRAANQGIEGFVEVEFDVTPIGSTENVRVIAAQPSNIFEKEAVKAVYKWRFSPVVVDGKAERFNGMVQRLVFEMAKS